MRPATLVRSAAFAAVAVLPVVSDLVLRRAARRLLDAPRRLPDEGALRADIDALGGEVVRLRARDGVALAGRWLLADPLPEPLADQQRSPAPDGGTASAWAPDPREAVLLLHGYSGSVAPDLVEYAPMLRRTAAVLGLDFRGHGDSADGPTTFGLLETEDVAGALAWLGERGIRRVALMGTSMGGIVAIAATAVLGEGGLAAADADPDAPGLVAVPPRPRIVGIVAESVAPELAVPVGSRLPGPFGRRLADRMFATAARLLGGDPRATEPGRVIGLLEGVPLLLIHDEADRTVPLVDGRRLAALAPPGARHLVMGGADHSAGHRADPAGYESAVTAFLRDAFTASRGGDGGLPILPDDAPPGTDAGEGANERA